MPAAYLCPWTSADAIELSRRTYKKQVLPKGSITYKGRTITFDDAYLAELEQAFVDRAYDQVPFLLADGDNAHTMDPERFRGEIRALQHGEDGLYAIVEFATDEAAAAVLANPSLGVSARIVEGYDRADGKTFPRAIQHVLGTLDPRVPGMKPWEAIALSTDQAEVIDLTAATIRKEGDMPDTLTAEDRAKFDAYLTELAALAAAGQTTDPGTTTDEATDAELEALLAELGEDANAGATLSNESRQAIELANAQATQARHEVAVLRQEADLARFEKEKVDLTNRGVPPVVVDALTPLLVGPHAIDLANGSQVTAGEVVRTALEALVGAGGLVDLSHETPGAPSAPASDKTRSLLDQWESQFPTKGAKPAGQPA